MDVQSGTRLNNNDAVPYIKKRLKGRGGYRLYYLLIIKDNKAYLMFIHPKTGPDGTENITKEAQIEIYKSAFVGIKLERLYKICFDESKKTINFEKRF